MIRPIDYVLCAAGNGERFKEVGLKIPKPLIKLNGTSLLERSLSSLDFQYSDRLIIITRFQDHVRTHLEEKIQNQYPYLNIVWLEIKNVTSGQLATFFLAKKYLRPNNASVVIFNCDTYFRSSDLSKYIQDKDVEGVVPCAKASGTAWSFCRVNAKNDILEIREKIRISSHATVGYYYFRDGKKLLSRTKKMLSNFKGKESYVAPLYQEYIDAKEKVKICKADIFLPMGTPDQIKTFWKMKLEKLKHENVSGVKVIVVDLDDTITIDHSSRDYESKKSNQAIIKKMVEYKKAGFTIIIHTARNMKTQFGDEGKVLANVGYRTLKWLKEHKVPYDGIRFGKPYAEKGFYVDDKAIRPDEFLKLSYTEILKLINS